MYIHMSTIRYFSINYHNINNNTMDAKVHSNTLLIKQNEDDKAYILIQF